MSTVTQTPAVLSVTFHRGDDLTLNVGLTDSNSDPIDITGWTLSAQVREVANASVVLASWTISNRNDAAGTFTMALTDSDTAGLPPTCVSDLQGTDAGGLVRTYLKMNMTVERDVTR